VNTVSILILDLTGPQTSLDGNALQIFVSSCGMVFPLIELACYLVFFHHVFTHDNGNIKKFLSKECIRQRNRTNAITFMGQFWGFGTEFAYMVIFTTTIVLGGTNTQLKAFSTVLKFTEFGLLSMVDVLASKPLRHDFIESVESMLIIMERMFIMIVWF
jgi:hypothetical protein